MAQFIQSGVCFSVWFSSDGHRPAVAVTDSVGYADAIRWIIAFINTVRNSNVICNSFEIVYSVGYDYRLANRLAIGNSVKLSDGHADAFLWCIQLRYWRYNTNRLDFTYGHAFENDHIVRVWYANDSGVCFTDTIEFRHTRASFDWIRVPTG
jgi:hypothetical protein